jgi:hypothetical protein
VPKRLAALSETETGARGENWISKQSRGGIGIFLFCGSLIPFSLAAQADGGEWADWQVSPAKLW